jgi:hypothetical protein
MAGRRMGDNMAQATATLCVSPEQMPRDVAMVATRLLPFQYGLSSADWTAAGYPGAPPPDVSRLWWPFVTLLMLAIASGGWRAWRDGPSEMSWFGAYLVMVGITAVAVYASTQCGRVGLGNLRYMLQSLFIAAGAAVLLLDREQRRAIVTSAAVLFLAWAGWNGYGHATLIRTFLSSPPERGYAQLARYLDDHDIRFVVTDYWVGNHVSFLTGERVRSWSFFNRVHEHALAVDAHREDAVEVRPASAGPCDRAVRVGGFYVCGR